MDQLGILHARWLVLSPLELDMPGNTSCNLKFRCDDDYLFFFSEPMAIANLSSSTAFQYSWTGGQGRITPPPPHPNTLDTAVSQTRDVI